MKKKFLQRKIFLIIFSFVIFALTYMICCKAYYGKIYFLGIGGSREEWNIERLNEAAKDFYLDEQGAFVSDSPDPWFTIEEAMPVKTIVIDIDDVEENGNSQVFYYSDNQALSEENSYWFELHQGLNYLQIPKGDYNKFRLDLTERSDVRMTINSIVTYGSRTIPMLFLAVVIGISMMIECLFLISFDNSRTVPRGGILRNAVEYKKLMAGALAVIAAYGIGAELAVRSQEATIHTDVLFLPCIYILYRAYMKCFSYKETRGFYCLTGGLSFLFSVMLIAGGQLETNSDLLLTATTFFEILCLTVAMYPVLSFVTLWLNQRETIVNQKVHNDKRLLPICFIVVLTVWGLAYLGLFPGVYGTDAPYWYYEFSNKDVPISSQWSPFYCGAFYGLVLAGEKIFGSYNAGFAVFSLVQMLFILMVIWNILGFLNKRFKGVAIICTTVFFSLIPTHVILALTSAQDSVFAACFAMCVLKLFELMENPKTFWEKKRNPIKLAAWLILLCMVRNNGLYAIFVMTFFVIIFTRKYKKQMLMLIGAVVVFVLVYQGPVYRMMEIEKGTAIREMLSFPLQQMAYAYNYGYESLSEEQIEQMLRYVSDEGWRSYEPCISDHVKACLNKEAVKENMGEFLRLYLDVFISAPECYVKGAALQTFGLWYPNKVWPDTRTWHPYIDVLCYTYGTELTDFTVSRSSMFSLYEEILSTLYGKGTNYSGYGGALSMAFSKIPVLGIFSNVGIYFWMMLYLFFYAIYRRWREPFIIIGIGIGIYATILLSPVIMYRYCAPMIFTAPLFFTVFFITEKRHDCLKCL